MSSLPTLKRFSASLLEQFDYVGWLASAFYFLVLALTHFGATVSTSSFSFLAGAVCALPVVTVLVKALNLKRSPLLTIPFQLGLVVVTLFALTSTVNFFGKGFVLSLFFYSLFLQMKEFLNHGNLFTWFQTHQAQTIWQQRVYFLIIVAIFTAFIIYLV